MEHATALPKAAPLCPSTLHHLGKRPAVAQAMSRLARFGKLVRVCRGVSIRPIQTGFRQRAPGTLSSAARTFARRA